MWFALKMLGLALTLVVSSLVVSSSAQCLTGNRLRPPMNPHTIELMKEARMRFALDALGKAANIEGPQSNIIFSPYSLHQVLTLSYFGARGTTECSLKKALHIPDELTKDDLLKAYGLEKSLQQKSQKNANGSYEYESANRLWINSAKRVRGCMLSLFRDELKKLNFKADPDDARDQINKWMSKTTKGQINDFIPVGGVDEYTDIVLANAVYFKGLWKTPFDKKYSQPDTFYGVQKSSVSFMHQSGTFNYVDSDELGAKVLELPYAGDEISMYIFLPSSTMRGDGIHQLIKKITTTERGVVEFRRIMDYDMPLEVFPGMSPAQVSVTLPQFSDDQELQLIALLQALGAGELISTEANLRGFTESALQLSDAIHRAKVDINEEGTTAAAVTAIFGSRAAPMERAVFNANRPFLYFIYNRLNQTTLFSGIYRGPLNPQP